MSKQTSSLLLCFATKITTDFNFDFYVKVFSCYIRCSGCSEFCFFTEVLALDMTALPWSKYFVDCYDVILRQPFSTLLLIVPALSRFWASNVLMNKNALGPHLMRVGPFMLAEKFPTYSFSHYSCVVWCNVVLLKRNSFTYSLRVQQQNDFS